MEVVTHDYYADPPNTPECPSVPPPPNGRDHVTDPNLKLDRRKIFIHDWGLENPRRVLRYAKMTWVMASKLRRAGLLRIHCTHAVPEVVSLLPLRWLYGDRVKIVCYAHGEEVTACCSSRQLRFLMHRANAAVDLMIANSKYTARALAGHIDPKKVHVVNPGVQIAQYQDAHEAGLRWRAEQGFADKLIVLTVGRLDPRKNHAAVIQAVAELAPSWPKLVYVIAGGEGRRWRRLPELAKRLGVADRVVFAGSVSTETKIAMYGGCDVFAMPAVRDRSDVEGFGMVFLEASACGKPTLAGKEGGQSEAVVDGQTGLVVDGADPRQVARALERLISDTTLRQRLGQAGREHAQGFDWANVVGRITGLVERLE